MKKVDNKTIYDPGSIEKKWQKVWEESGIFSPDISGSNNHDYEQTSQKGAKQPFYNLMMFPYPSAEGLHVGNMYAFTGADVYARYNRMLGKDVLEPIGLDGFGIHSENYALKVGRHPKEQAGISETNFYRQLRSIGNSFDWKRTLETYHPDYYKWTQWLFIQMFKKCLAYRDTALVNWCPKDLTVLSDEQVIDGKCERCGSVVEKRDLEQWFFRITNYAERLLKNIEGLNWTEKVKIAQRNWIGKSEGAEIEFVILNPFDNAQGEGSQDSSALPQNDRLRVFTTRPDTLYGATFMVISPEHEIVASLLSSEFKVESSKIEEIRKYVQNSKNKTEIERTAEDKEKTGVFSGLYAINPVNGKSIPVWIADYVLYSYGTGAIMAVPAHDQRDYEFAKKYSLEIVSVIQSKEGSQENVKNEGAFTGGGIIIGSESWNGFHVPADIPQVINDLEKRGLGKKKANFHLRDWLISRQRYWGPPIPLVFCENCANKGKSWFSENQSQGDNQVSGIRYRVSSEEFLDPSVTPQHYKNWDSAGWFPVPESDLPVLLPDVKDWKPEGTGKSPLANHPEFYKTTCPNCGGEAQRETDVSDTFLDSAWYFLRYPSIGEQKSKIKDQKDNAENSVSLPFDLEITRKWLPVDQYIGGAEHSVLHLLYSRFVTMALHDMGLLNFEEPFTNFFAHGLIIKDGAKMSKSKGNVVVPDEYIAKYGADTLRTYLMFIGPYSDGGDFRDSGIEGMHRFLKKVWKMIDSVILIRQQAEKDLDSSSVPQNEMNQLNRIMHQTIKGVTEDIGSFKYNTSIAKLMEYYNALNEFYTKYKILDIRFIETFLKLLAPFAPHMTEELWQNFILIRQSTEKDLDSSQAQNDTFKSIHLEPWPEYDEKYLVSEVVIIVVQVNGKRRGEIQVQSSKIKEQNEIESMAKEVVSTYLEGKEVKKIIYVPGKIINFAM